MSKPSLRVFIDRIEGELAVIVLSDDDSVKFNLPVKYLPEDATEGAHLRLSLTVDNESREYEKQKIDGLLKKLRSKN
jgi:Protein of unknown function (DUF3006)